jgi:lysozyme
MTRKFIRVGAVAIVACMALLAAGILHYLGFEPAGARYPVRGVDLSHHQGRVDWDALKAAGVDFAFIKATEGGDFVDPRFAENWRQAGRVGIRRGAYHFFTLCCPARHQARNFMAMVPLTPGALPAALDLEFSGNCRRRPPKAELLAEIRLFLSLVEGHFGSKPVLYMSQAFHDAYLEGAFADYPAWLRSLYFEPDYGGRDWLFWQFHNLGRLPGVAGPIDLNVFRHDRQAFEALFP